MANNVKINPIGLDAVIHRVQSTLYTKLTALWAGVPLDGYPRCYIINRDGKRTIEHFVKDKEYKSLIHAEGNKFFFTSEGDVERVREMVLTNLVTEIDLYFIVDVPKIKTGLIHRGDEEIRNDVMNALLFCPEVTLTRVVKNIDKVFNGFDYKNVNDMQPYHCFKITLEVKNFKINQKNC